MLEPVGFTSWSKIFLLNISEPLVLSLQQDLKVLDIPIQKIQERVKEGNITEELNIIIVISKTKSYSQQGSRNCSRNSSLKLYKSKQWKYNVSFLDQMQEKIRKQCQGLTRRIYFHLVKNIYT